MKVKNYEADVQSLVKYSSIYIVETSEAKGYKVKFYEDFMEREDLEFFADNLEQAVAYSLEKDFPVAVMTEIIDFSFQIFFSNNFFALEPFNL